MNDKQRPEKVIVEPYFYGESFYCPSCGKYIGGNHDNLSDINFCSKCGQALDIKNR